MTDPVLRQKWVAMLAKLCSPMDPVTAAAALAAMLPLLHDLPDAAFCDESLAHVAGGMKRTPSYAELNGALSAWWRENRGRFLPPGLPDRTQDGLTPEDQAHVRCWFNLREQGDLDKRLRLYRSKWPDAFAHVCRSDELAALAAQRLWPVE